MTLKKRLFIGLTAIGVLLLIQTVTFLTIAPRQLKYKLFHGKSISKALYSDSLFVQDYYYADCNVGDFYVFNHTLNLRAYSDKIKENLGVKYIYFSDKAKMEERIYDKFPLVYLVSARSRNWVTLFGLYECRLDEFLRDSKEKSNVFIDRRTNYRWFMFFWVQTTYN